MFWNVTFIYNAFICTTDHCKVQTAFVSLFYIFINITVKRIIFFSCCWKATPTRAFNEFFLQIFTNFFNFGKFVKIREFFC